jgi:hypothetical protein
MLNICNTLKKHKTQLSGLLKRSRSSGMEMGATLRKMGGKYRLLDECEGTECEIWFDKDYEYPEYEPKIGHVHTHPDGITRRHQRRTSAWAIMVTPSSSAWSPAGPA